MQIERTCNLCNNKFMAHHNNHGLMYNDKKIYVCNECMHITKPCAICGKDVKILFNKFNKDAFCSRYCINKHNTIIMKKNCAGIFNPEFIKKFIAASHTVEANKLRTNTNRKNSIGLFNKEFQEKCKQTNIKNKTGCYDFKVREKAQKASHTFKAEKQRTKNNKNNLIGIYNAEIRAKGQKTRKEKCLGIYSKEAIIASHTSEVCARRIKSQKENKNGIYNLIKRTKIYKTKKEKII